MGLDEKDGLLQIGGLAAASFCVAVPFAIEVLPITDARLKKAWDHDLYRVRLTMTGGMFTMKSHDSYDFPNEARFQLHGQFFLLGVSHLQAAITPICRIQNARFR